MSLTTDRSNPDLHEVQGNGQNKAYLVLSDEELAKGYVRPVRTKYIHRGQKIFNLTTLTEKQSHNGKDLVASAKYSEDASGGPLLTQEEVDQYENTGYINGCGGETVMNEKIAQVYATNPGFYGATFCVHCGKHLPVSQFIWSDTDEMVGS